MLAQRRTFREIWKLLVRMNLRGNPYGPISRCLVFRTNLYGPVVLKVCQEFPPRLVSVHGWFVPVPSLERAGTPSNCYGMGSAWIAVWSEDLATPLSRGRPHCNLHLVRTAMPAEVHCEICRWKLIGVWNSWREKSVQFGEGFATCHQSIENLGWILGVHSETFFRRFI